jgi:hypothetical protein
MFALQRQYSILKREQERKLKTQSMLSSVSRQESLTIEEQELQRDIQFKQATMLLVLYPVLYIWFWMGNMVHRALELAGRANEFTMFISAWSQLIGLADSITYGWTVRHIVRKEIRGLFDEFMQRKSNKSNL